MDGRNSEVVKARALKLCLKVDIFVGYKKTHIEHLLHIQILLEFVLNRKSLFVKTSLVNPDSNRVQVYFIKEPKFCSGFRDEVLTERYVWLNLGLDKLIKHSIGKAIVEYIWSQFVVV